MRVNTLGTGVAALRDHLGLAVTHLLTPFAQDVYHVERRAAANAQ